MDHVIVGAGPAGIIAAETLRKHDTDCGITIIGDEPEPPYSRMAIPYLLAKQIDEAGTYLRKHDRHFDELGIEIVRDRVTGVDATANSLALESGASRGFDKLLIATGSRPATPPIDGVASPGVLPCWTLCDARRIIEWARPGAEVVLIGAGFIGCIILEALATRGATLTVVESADRMVARMMNATSANLIRKWCEHKGVTVHTGATVTAIEQGRAGGTLAVALDNGTTLNANLVITATGVNPNIEFLDGSGIDTAQGMRVNNQLQSSVADIYAAGDVAEGIDFSTGGHAVHAIQPTAAEHGRIAASNMAGHTSRYHGSVIMNVLDTMGLISSSFGLWDGADGGDATELVDPARYRYLNLQFEDDRLVGANSLGVTEHIGVIRGLIQTRVKLGKWKDKLMQDPTRVMEAYVARTQAIGYNAHVL
ncbi:MAG: NAD(P)/FAD-dependent oxidoreductase [Pseudomonadota bacterium]|nr:MAG: NAD(P)/FAD-dependent oxidoreductase [Pseudomonadota bacterium]